MSDPEPLADVSLRAAAVMPWSAVPRRLPVGAEVLPDGRVNFRVWAPRRSRVEICLGEDGADGATPLAPEESGYFTGISAAARDGTLYRIRLDGQGLFPDPASRFQPQGRSAPRA